MITVQKRNGDVVPFQYEKIEQAVVKAAAATHAPALDPCGVVDAVTDAIRNLTFPVSVETIQDAVERALLAQGHRDVAKAFMAYRDEKAAMRRRRPVSAATRSAFDEAATYFPTALQQFQFFDKYSRFNYALGRRETWVETVNRAVDFLVELTEATTGQRRGEVVEWLRGDGREMMLHMEALPSMRLLAMAGEPARRQNLALYNCSYVSVDDPQAWVEMLIISMSGCGVGFSVERKYIDKLPSVVMQTGRLIDHIVDDSTEGWAEALRLGLQSWFVDGVDVRYDFSQVRPAGAPLKTKGGRASGPDPLRIMLLSIRNIILSRQGQRLRDTDAHTISCHVGQAAVQGGMRRTAMISLSDADSTDMARIKQGNYDPVLWNANNSSVWHGGVDDLTILRHFVEMDEGKNGERGIFSRDAAMATMPERRRALWPDGVGAGTNPCIVGDTLVYLADGRGHVPIKQLAEEGADVPVFCIDRRGFLTVRTMRNPRVTGYQVPVLKVTLDDGSSLTVTPNHKFCTSEGAWVAVNSLKPGDSIGTLVKSLDSLSFGATRQGLEQNFIAASRALRQGYDAELVGGVWVLNKRCEKCDKVFKTPLTLREVGFCSPQCWENRKVTEKFNCETATRVVAVEAAGVADVYNGTVDEFHNFFVGGFPQPDGKGYVYVNNLQCGEIVLRSSGQLCNLSIAVARADDTIASLSRKVKAAAIFGTIQSTATNFPGLRPIWKENCDAERLLGVDINGQLDCPLFTGGGADVAFVYSMMREHAISQNNQTAAALGINASTAVTCVKPSGNSSTLLDCSPGLHPRHATYYIRNVRVSSHSPVYKVLRDAGAPLSPENGQTAETATTWVCSFPCKAPDGATVKADETAIDQLERWLLCKRWYTEHNPSCFSGDQRFITDQGLRRFDSFAHGSVVSVLDRDGQWTPARVEHFGSQKIWEITLERAGASFTVRTTENHLWPVTSPQGRFKGSAPHQLTTRELMRHIGSSHYKLDTVNPQFTVDMHNSLAAEGILHGIVYGDGSKNAKGKCQVYLCNDPSGCDKRKLATLFSERGFKLTDRPDLGQTRIYGLPGDWKDLPASDVDPAYLRGFIAGWFATDGNIGTSLTISSSNRADLEWLQQVAPRAGIAVSTRIGETKTLRFKECPHFNISLSKESLDASFFIFEDKKLDDRGAFKKYWKITDVRETDSVEPVFCVVEPKNQMFVLEGNILTHNCTIVYRPHELVEVAAWVARHRDIVGGLSFLPYSGAAYEQMPYIEITREEYEARAAAFPVIDWSKLVYYEDRDLTTAAQELACAAGACLI